MAESEIHVLRVRQKDSKEPFLDALADIKYIFTQGIREAKEYFKDVFPEDKADYLNSILKVLITRLEEDKAPLDEQYKAFMDAFGKFTEAEQQLIINVFARYVFCTFLLHYRRDAKVDVDDRANMRGACALLALKADVPESTYLALKEALKEVSKHVESKNTQVSTVDANWIRVTKENGEEKVEQFKVTEDIKDIAASNFGVTGSTKWEDVARACDNFILNTESEDDKAVAISLAYPDYSTPYFEIKVDNEHGNDTK